MRSLREVVQSKRIEHLREVIDNLRVDLGRARRYTKRLEDEIVQLTEENESLRRGGSVSQHGTAQKAGKR